MVLEKENRMEEGEFLDDVDDDEAAELVQLLHSNDWVWVAYGGKWAVLVKGKSD